MLPSNGLVPGGFKRKRGRPAKNEVLMQEAMNEAANLRNGGNDEGSRDFMESIESNEQSLDVLRP